MGGLQGALRRWFGDYVVAIVVAMVIVVPLVRPTGPDWPLLRNLVLELMGVLLLCAVVVRLDLRARAGERLARFLFSGVNGLVLAFVAWALCSAFWVAPAGAGRTFALLELFRLGAGVVVYLVVANHVEGRRQFEALLDAILIVVGFATLYRIFVPHWMPDVSPSPIGTRLLAGAFLSLLLPVVAAIAAAPLHPRRQIAARVVLVLTVVTLLATPTRSSWIGALAGMAVFGALAVRHLADGVGSLRAHQHRVVYPVLALGGALLVLVTMSDVSERAAERARTLPAVTHGEDGSFRWRLDVWKGAVRAIARHPLFGFGLGNYVLRQRDYTGLGQTEAEVVREGSSMSEQAHNEYLHVAAELGLPGLGLYLLTVFAFFAKSAHALERLPSGARKVLLIGCTAAVAAQCVDAASNPAWRFSACALYFWLVLGLGVALVRSAYRRPGAVASLVAAAERVDDEARAAVG